MPQSVDALIAAAAELHVELERVAAHKLLRLLDELDEWNRHTNLTAIREREQQITKHLLDSLSVQPFLRGVRILDFGTGAGFPGLPLALVNPQRRFTLLDATAKKLRFVAHAAPMLDLDNVETVHARAETYKPPQRFDTVLARAVGPLERLIDWCGHLCVGGGRLLAMKGRYPEEELRHLPSGWKIAAVHPLVVPGLGEQRHLVEICRSHDKVE